MTDPSMVIVTGAVTARPDTVDEVAEICLAHVRRSRTEAGCLLHSVHRDCENDRRFVFLEHWESLAHLRAHFEVPDSIALVEALQARCEDLSPIEIFTVEAHTAI